MPLLANNKSAIAAVRAALLALLALSVGPALAKPDGRRRIARPRRELILLKGATEEQIWDSGLVEKSLSAATLYEKGQQHYRDTGVKRFRGRVLGYVTPWHKRGYDRAVRYRAKFTHVAPVWYQLKREADTKSWVLQGGHEYNATWVQEVRQPTGEAGSVTKVVPRVIFEFDSGQDHVDLVTAPEAAVKLLTHEVVSRDYDGLVVEVWMTWSSLNALSNEGFVAAAEGFLAALSQALRSAQDRPRELILAVPPAVPQAYNRPFLARELVQRFDRYVDGWSVMTYDYAVNHPPYPNSPLPWLQGQAQVLLEPSKEGPAVRTPGQLLLGMNFYGYDFSARGAEAVIVDGVLSLLSRHQPPLEWHDEYSEHSFDYKAADGQHTVFYPTPRGLELRLELFQQWGVGVSIWELGQGLERFFDLL